METPEIIKPKHEGTKQAFDNPILERLSRTHVSVPITLYLVLSAVLLWMAVEYTFLALWAIPLVFLAGLITWSFGEYMLHKHVFHMSTHTKRRQYIQYKFHGLHHEYPKDKDRLAMPPIMSIIIAAVLFSIFYLLMNTAVFAFLPGVMTGYATYLFVHFIVHAYPKPNNIFGELWVNHAVHHYKDPTVVFGVSSPLWDYIFGTTRDKAKNKFA